MKQNLALISLVVDDYDRAIDFYTNKLHFQLIEDTAMTPSKRWVVVAPPGADGGCRILLAKAADERQVSAIGNQTGGRVFLFLHTDDFDRDYKNLVDNNIKIIKDATNEEWGKVCVFADTYGNLWDLIEPK